MTEREKLLWACRVGSLEDLKRLLDRRVLGIRLPPPIRVDADAFKEAICSPHSTPEIIRYLASRGADVNGAYMGQVPMLAVAVSTKRRELVEALIDAGARVTPKESQDYVPLDVPLVYACELGSLELTELLLSRGADPNRGYREKSPLYAASEKGSLPLAELLLERGASVNPDYGRPPLLAAAEGGFADLVRLLLERGADPRAATIHGVTPAMAAAAEGHANILEILQESNAPTIPPLDSHPQRESRGSDKSATSRTRRDYETEEGIELSMVPMEHHYEGLAMTVSRCIDYTLARVPLEHHRMILEHANLPVRRHSEPHESFKWKSSMNPDEEFAPILLDTLPQHVAKVLMDSVSALDGDLETWQFLTRKYFRYVFDVHFGVIPPQGEERR